MITIGTRVKPIHSEKAIFRKVLDHTHMAWDECKTYTSLLFENGGVVTSFVPVDNGDGVTRPYFLVEVESDNEAINWGCHFFADELKAIDTDVAAPDGNLVRLDPSKRLNAKDWLLNNWFGDPSMGDEVDKVLDALESGSVIVGCGDKDTAILNNGMRIPCSFLIKGPEQEWPDAILIHTGQADIDAVLDQLKEKMSRI